MQMTNLASMQCILWNILEKYGQDPEEIFRAVKLDPLLLHEPGRRYPVRKTDQLWREAARKIPDTCFGLLASKCWHPSHLGGLGYAMLASTSLRTSLERMIRFHRVVSDNSFAVIHTDDITKNLVFTLTDRNGDPPEPCLEDAALALIMSILSMNYQQELKANMVSFRHPAPDCAARYTDFFRSPVYFDAPATCLHLPLAATDKILPGRDKKFATLGEQLMTEYLASLDDAQLPLRIEKIIFEHLPSGDANLETVANRLHMSTRTLQRHLRLAGTTFQQIHEQTRKKLAKAYVLDRKMNLSEIAFLLGFSEVNTFSRSFKRWTGKSPQQFREASQGHGKK